jgi:two-component sensor histidine kinase
LSQVYTDGEKKINLLIEVSDVYLSVDQAIPCALILKELTDWEKDE